MRTSRTGYEQHKPQEAGVRGFSCEKTSMVCMEGDRCRQNGSCTCPCLVAQANGLISLANAKTLVTFSELWWLPYCTLSNPLFGQRAIGIFMWFVASVLATSEAADGIHGTVFKGSGGCGTAGRPRFWRGHDTRHTTHAQHTKQMWMTPLTCLQFGRSTICYWSCGWNN